MCLFSPQLDNLSKYKEVTHCLTSELPDSATSNGLPEDKESEEEKTSGDQTAITSEEKLEPAATEKKETKPKSKSNVSYL